MFIDRYSVSNITFILLGIYVTNIYDKTVFLTMSLSSILQHNRDDYGNIINKFIKYFDHTMVNLICIYGILSRLYLPKVVSFVLTLLTSPWIWSHCLRIRYIIFPITLYMTHNSLPKWLVILIIIQLSYFVFKRQCMKQQRMNVTESWMWHSVMAMWSYHSIACI